MIHVDPPDLEQLADMRERETFFRQGANKLIAAARELAAEGHAIGTGIEKVWLWEAVTRMTGRTEIDPIIARMIVAWATLGWIHLQRRDMRPFDPAEQLLMDQSEIMFVDPDHPKDNGVQYHYIVLEDAPKPHVPRGPREKLGPRVGVKNPSSLQNAGAAKYREFHRKPVKDTVEAHPDLSLPNGWACPRHVALLGEAKHVLYRSDKVDPETLKQPRHPIDYIHEHDSFGVKTYAPQVMLDHDDYELEAVPTFIIRTDTLVKLGDCLGVAYDDGDGIVELTGKPPLSELYTTPCGRALIVIAGKRTLELLIWGGALGVEDRGIVG